MSTEQASGGDSVKSEEFAKYLTRIVGDIFTNRFADMQQQMQDQLLQQMQQQLQKQLQSIKSDIAADRENRHQEMMEFKEAMRASLKQDMQLSLQGIKGEIGELTRGIASLNDRMERQERRLSAIESFPMPPISRPNRLYATDAHSVSRPHRVAVGYAG